MLVYLHEYWLSTLQNRFQNQEGRSRLIINRAALRQAQGDKYGWFGK